MDPKNFIRLKSGFLYDPEHAEMIDPKTGEIYPASVYYSKLYDQKDKKAIAISNKLKGEGLGEFCAFEDFVEVLKELCHEALHVTRSNRWIHRTWNPDLQVGQSIPWDEKRMQLCKNKDGIMFTLNKKQIPNCVEIEHKDGTVFRTEEEALKNANPGKFSGKDHEVEQEIPRTDLPSHPEFFETLIEMIIKFQKNPAAGYWKWLPVLFEYLSNHINLQDPSGDISIPDLLSAFTRLRGDNKVWQSLVQSSEQELKRVRKVLDKTRAKLYKSRIHKNHP
jgi:hypothetical protein